LKHLPNLLTAARIAMAPYIFYLLSIHSFDAALVWFAVASATDILDGFLARRLHADSRIGAYLDPIADKILLSGSFLVLAFTGAIPWWLTALVLGRDALILAGAIGALIFRKTPGNFTPSVWGKASTFAQILYVLAVVAGLPSEVLSWVVAVLAVTSGAHYAIRLFSSRE